MRIKPSVLIKLVLIKRNKCIVEKKPTFYSNHSFQVAQSPEEFFSQIFSSADAGPTQFRLKIVKTASSDATSRRRLNDTGEGSCTNVR